MKEFALKGAKSAKPRLENDHNVYVLGAGFSREANMPLISDFLIRMRDSRTWLARQKRKQEIRSIDEVLQFRLGASSASYWIHLDLENIEELFSLSSSLANGLDEHIQVAIAATLDFCEQTADKASVKVQVSGSHWARSVTWLRPVSNEPDVLELGTYAHHVAKLLGMLRSGRPAGRNTFITFNYDTVLERALDELRIRYGYCFKKQSVDYDTSDRTERGDDPQIAVLKLHGSVNWGRRQKKGRTLTVFGDYASTLKAGAIPALVPPTWKKIFSDQMEDIWSKAIESIQSATRVVVVGFSIPPTDMHFTYLLAAGLKDNLSVRKVLFLNPDVEAVKRNTEHRLRQNYIQNGKIAFHQHQLGQMCTGAFNLQELGRPTWVRGDKPSIQFVH